MQADLTTHRDSFDWQRQPAAADFVHRLVDECCRRCGKVDELGRRLYDKTGTRLVDWVDHLSVGAGQTSPDELTRLGFSPRPNSVEPVWDHPAGLFPAIRELTNAADDARGISLKVDSVDDFCAAQGLTDRVSIDGGPLASLRQVTTATEDNVSLSVIERHGTRDFSPSELTAAQRAALPRHAEALRKRRRDFEDAADGFSHALKLIRAAEADLGIDRTCDLFFIAERGYWQGRNHAARVQKERQDALGMGWGNHDHHTYRCGRAHFAQLIGVLEALGFACRERFYAGSEAGWGAQVLEQSQCGVVIFADVDLTPDEVTGDFDHQGLDPRDTLGTVGLWCALHGESFLRAGMHHLECQFDFDAVRRQLVEQGVETMPPFTDFPHLKQAFTVGEIWPVLPERVETARAAGTISGEQAAEFLARGAIGSHLEILQRNEGYKGFNQTGISDIIRQTDPRRQPVTSGE